VRLIKKNSIEKILFLLFFIIFDSISSFTYCQAHSTWMIQEQNEDTAPRKTAIGNVVLDQKLIPFGLAKIENDLDFKINWRGKIRLQKEDQFFKLYHPDNTVNVYCFFGNTENGKIRKKARNYNICLRDTTNDGTFDQISVAYLNTTAIPIISELREFKSLEPIKFSIIPNEEFFGNFHIRIKYSHISISSGDAVFTIWAGRISEEGKEIFIGLSDTFEMPSHNPHEIIDILGAKIEFLSYLDQKTIELKVLNGMPKQPFSIKTTTTTTYQTNIYP
jgi:hypothetical protein